MHPTHWLISTQVVFLGDSWAEFAGDLTLVDHCPTITEFENRGVGGSTAREWQEAEGCGGRACSPAAAFDGEETHAWVSIGGNDFIRNDCRPPDDFRNVLDTAFEDVAAAAGPDVKILPAGVKISASRGSTAVSRHRGDSFPRMMDVGGFFFEFEAIRTVSSEYDAPRRRKRWTSRRL